MPAPKSTTNALKQGLYARQFNDDQRQGLKKMAWDDFRHEEFAARTHAADLFNLLQSALRLPVVSVDHVTRLSACFVAAINAVATSASMHAHLNGQAEKPFDPLSEALDNVPFDEDPTDEP
jgi:hypothetical protein